jgi:hypothetical protein
MKTLHWGTIADWSVALATFLLAAVAIFQETIRGWWYHPVFRVSSKTEPPDCVAVPITDSDETITSDSIYLRLWVENVGKATAKNVEVYANELRRKRLDDTWERVDTFPRMNLNWANIGAIYFPRIVPGMGKHCDVGHIADPRRRFRLREDSPRLHLTVYQTSLAFDLMAPPKNWTHIVGPGEYELDVLVAAENAFPLKRTITINLRGNWDSDEAKMLRDGVSIAVRP